ncbi:MAG: hypothetical protein K9M80_01460 [Candidatus Marinimicrobia bacterium]|nr:hypothetical protein [Candidatus Neomarinimicrobiota bacterium]
MITKKVKFVPLIMILVLSIALAQKSPSYPQPPKLITVPTAGILPGSSYIVALNLYHSGGVTSGIQVGLTNRLMLGVSYSASHVIGNRKIEWGTRPEAMIKYRLFEETNSMPAFLIGFNSKGRGAYIDDLDRYEMKAKGLFLTVSRNFNLLGNFGIHGGINYNPIENKYDDDPSFYLGFDKAINPEITIMAEYDAALNDNASNEITLDNGYLNAGIRWLMFEHFHFEIDFRDILMHHNDITVEREITLHYVDFF